MWITFGLIHLTYINKLCYPQKFIKKEAKNYIGHTDISIKSAIVFKAVKTTHKVDFGFIDYFLFIKLLFFED